MLSMQTFGVIRKKFTLNHFKYNKIVRVYNKNLCWNRCCKTLIKAKLYSPKTNFCLFRNILR